MPWRFGSPSGLVDGNVGLRYVHTQTALNGNRTLSGGGVRPIQVNSSL
jgi:hypothetical protein